MEAVDDRKKVNPSAVSLQSVPKEEIEWFRSQGMDFNLYPVVKVRIEYQALFDTEIKKDVGGTLMQLPAILYYYVGQKNQRYFIATAIPLKATSPEKADRAVRNAASDMIMAIPMEGSNGRPPLPDGNNLVIVDLDDTSKTVTSKSAVKPVNENILLSEAFWQKATLNDVKRAIETGLDVNAQGNDDEIPLILAAAYNHHPDVIDLLMRHGADINVQDRFGLTPLMAAAASNQNPDVIDRLIGFGADIHKSDSDKRTPLIAAAYGNTNPDMIDRLIKYGADIEARDEDGMTPLACAASLNENPEVLERLIQHGANIRAIDNGGHTVLFWAEENRHIRNTEVYLLIRQELSQ